MARSGEDLAVRDRVKFRVGRLVYLAFFLDETLMSFGFPEEERDALEPNPDGSRCRIDPTSGIAGCSSGSMRSMRSRCASWSSTRCGWSCAKRVAAPYLDLGP
jgi:hypothetical protein